MSLSVQNPAPPPRELGAIPTKEGAGLAVRRAWLPIPLLVLAMLVLWAADLRNSYDPPWLLFTLNFLFATIASGVIVYLVGKSFLARGTPGLLLLSCGVVFWGLAGVTSAAVGGTNYNASLTIHNLCAWLSAFCHLTGVVLSTRTQPSMAKRAWWLLAGFLGTVGIASLVAKAAVAGWTPVFFVQGEGGTLVRHLVLSSASVMFILSAIVLRAAGPPAASSGFSRWYGFGLVCFSAALFGLMIQSVHGSALGWTARSAQWLGGIYLLIAAFAVARESKAREISLSVVPDDARLRYALAMVFVAAAVILRLVFLEGLGTRVVAVTLYPAVLLATLFGGRGPGLLAAGLSTLAIDLLWLRPSRILSAGEGGDALILATFLASSILIVWVTDAMQRAQARASAAEGELKLATERKRVEEHLRASEERLRLATQTGKVGLWEWDIAANRVSWTDSLFAIHGIKKDEFDGTVETFSSLIHPLDRATVTKAIERSLQEGVPYELRFRAVHPDGRPIWIFTNATVLRRDGMPMSMIGASVDITDLTRAEEALRDAHKQLADRAVHLETLVEERTAELAEMVNELEHVSYAITHDMRAPLRAMSAFATALSEWARAGCGPSAEAQDYCRRILTAADRLDRLIQDALHYTKAALQKMPLCSVDLGKLVRGLIDSYPNLQPEHADLLIEGELPVVQGNEALLTQCFSNLLGNAVKFVAPGTKARVRIYAEKRDGVARIWIADNGIGIPEHGQKRLFGMFQKLDNQYEGTGIGLAIVRKVAERMGGKVGVESEPGRGSRFWVELRVPPPSSQ